MPRDRTENCNAIGRLIKDLCSCSEYGTWSPDMTSDKKKGPRETREPLLKCELTNMSAVRRRIMTIAKRKTRDDTLTPQPPKLLTNHKKTDTLTSNLINATMSSQNSTIRRNIDNFLLSRRMFALEEDLYEKPIRPVKNSNYGENWSLSKAWRLNNEYFDESPTNSYRIEHCPKLERIEEIPRRERKRRSRKFKEQLRYDKHIKRHLRIRVMLSLRMRRYMKRRLRKNKQVVPVAIPPRKFIRGSSDTSSFGTRSYRSVMTDKLADGTVLFDVHEARNTMLELCHDYEEDLDTLEIALRAGNFR